MKHFRLTAGQLDFLWTGAQLTAQARECVIYLQLYAAPGRVNLSANLDYKIASRATWYKVINRLSKCNLITHVGGRYYVTAQQRDQILKLFTYFITVGLNATVKRNRLVA